ncbi:UNVERIFIED_ORG: hypothetical protein B5F06_05290 [Lacrimispora saccharolytica]
MNTGVFADTQSWHNPLIQSCTVSAKEKGQLWLSKTVLIRLKDMEKDITLERFFLFTVKVILIRIINA